MKNLFVPAVAALLLFTLSFCKNTPLPEGHTKVNANTPIVEAPDSAAAPLPPGKTDSLAGFKGCETASWSAVSANTDEFIYQHFIVRKTLNADTPGEQITVLSDSGRATFELPVPENAFFHGVCRNKVFVDVGTGPDGRQLLIFDVDKHTQYFSTPYCGDLQVVQSEKLYFLLPVSEQDVAKMPDCPQREEWTKQGLRVGYGQRCIMNLLRRSLVKKSEWVCVAMQ